MSLLLSSLLMSTSGVFISKNLLKNNVKPKPIQTIFSILLMSTPALLFYELNYNGLIPLITFIISIFAYRSLFKETLSISLLLASFVMLLTSITDLFLMSVLRIITNVHQAREIWYIMLFANLFIAIVSVFLSKIPLVKNLFEGIAIRLSKKVYLSTIIFICLFLCAIIVLHYNITSIFKLNEVYVMTLISLSVFFLLYYIYMIEQINYDKLSNEYNALFECIQTFENWIDKEQLGIHEMKNTLSVIRGITNEKKIQDKIDEILKESFVIDEDWVEQLKIIPKGGIKGLLYYKMAVAKSKKVRLFVEVSPKINSKFKSLDNNMIKKLCILLGIYLDNAIESAEGTKKAQVTLEIYLCNQNLVFVISNTYKERPNLETMNKKGVSSKGFGRGKGLYFAQKTITKNKNFLGIQQIMNDFYIQKLIVELSK